ncbi:MAG TPA: DegT/DnrJ/EryC1/StrS family aminotransferase [Candidatus Angelobacter sp.]|nr:DegT/DnrJ/EryC1/StrS family aminotransferase [Candidatus Angelobacter sp.]
MITIPQAAPARRMERYRAEIDNAIAGVITDGHYILGPALERFEEAFAAYLGVNHCIGVNSGTDALTLALHALGIGPGDEVITTSLTFAGTAQAILHCGAQPCFVDVDPLTRCIDPAAVEAAIHAKTAAIVPVHLFGHPAAMQTLLHIAARHGLAVIEDCAQAHGTSIDGRKAGTFGNAAAFSFYPTKNLGCIGDGGAIVTNDATLAAKLRSLRHYGWADEDRVSWSLGSNSRLDAIQAAVLTALLPHLDEGNRERRALATEYRRLINNDGAMPLEDPGAIYHQFAITCPQRDALRKYLGEKAGIGTAIHYHPALHLQPAFAASAAIKLPETERLAAELLSLPIQPEVAGPHLARIAEAVREGMRLCRAS